MSRWTDLATWRGPTVNQVRGHAECRGLVVHIAQGTFEGTVSWCKNPASQISCHFVAGKTGQRAQLVDTDDTAWTQADGNGHWLSVECEGFVPDTLTAAQVEFVAQLLARGHQQYGYPLQLADTPTGMGLGYHAMGGLAWGGHLDCPGPNIIAQRPAILARAQQIAAGGDVTPEEHDAVMTAAAFAGGCAAGADTYWVYDHTKPGGRTSQPLAPFYARVAAEVAKAGGAPGGLVPHDHSTPAGVTGPAQPA